MYSEDVTTKDGTVKTVVANSPEELAEAVAVVKNDKAAVSPDITVAGDNAIVSPDNKHTEDPYVQPPDPELAAPVVKEEEAPKKTSKKK